MAGRRREEGQRTEPQQPNPFDVARSEFNRTLYATDSTVSNPDSVIQALSAAQSAGFDSRSGITPADAYQQLSLLASQASVVFGFRGDNDAQTRFAQARDNFKAEIEKLKAPAPQRDATRAKQP